MFSDDNVRDRFEDKLYVTRICGLCDVCVDGLATWVFVETNKLVSYEVDAILIGVSSCRTIEERGRERESD